MSSGWACQTCTFINERGAKICNACGRTLGLPTVNLNPSGIECSQCTYQNPNGSVNCAMCEMPIVIQDTHNLSAVMEMDVGQNANCQICYCNLTEEFKMTGCAHSFCVPCAKQYFAIKIRECGINNFRCPIDGCVSFDESANKTDFFVNLKTALHSVLDAKTRKMFADKVGILDIMDKPGFIGCSMCNHGFVNQSKSKMTHCPECLRSFCSLCDKKWTNGHSQTICEPNANEIVDGEVNDMQMYTNAACPQCKYKYFLERGGCMHITCSQIVRQSIHDNELVMYTHRTECLSVKI